MFCEGGRRYSMWKSTRKPFEVEVSCSGAGEGVTVKLILHKAVTKEGKNWDKLIHYLLFAHREVPQAYTSFSPFD